MHRSFRVLCSPGTTRAVVPRRFFSSATATSSTGTSRYYSFSSLAQTYGSSVFSQSILSALVKDFAAIDAHLSSELASVTAWDTCLLSMQSDLPPVDGSLHRVSGDAIPSPIALTYRGRTLSASAPHDVADFIGHVLPTLHSKAELLQARDLIGAQIDSQLASLETNKGEGICYQISHINEYTACILLCTSLQ